MYFDIQRRSYCSIDRKTFFRTIIHVPRFENSVRYKYISEFIRACESFANNVLYPLILKNNISQFHSSIDKSVFFYEVKVEEITVTESQSSFIIYSCLKLFDKIIASGIKTVSFYGENIVPSRIINNKRKYRDSNTVWNREGKPCKAYLDNGFIKIERIK